MRACGLVIALAGIAALLLPGAKAPPLYSALMMIAAGLAWAAYSVRGRAGQEAGASTAANFVLATPMALALSLLFMKQGHYDAAGIAFSLLSGAPASGGAYVLWYTLLPSLGSITASTLQLSVPCLAMLGGVVFLDESLTVRTIGADWHCDGDTREIPPSVDDKGERTLITQLIHAVVMILLC